MTTHVQEARCRMKWLAYNPAFGAYRRELSPLGAHAFADGAEYSLCGLAPRSKDGGCALPNARRCTRCEWISSGKQASAPVPAKRPKSSTTPTTRTDSRPTCPVCGSTGTDPCRGFHSRIINDHELRSGRQIGNLVEIDLTARAHRRLHLVAKKIGVNPGAIVAMLVEDADGRDGR